MIFSVDKGTKLLITILTFISAILLSFLLLGCVGTAGIYLKVYLAELRFNESSDLFGRIQAYYGSVNSTNLSNITINLGYLSACINTGNITCSSYKVLDQYIGGIGVPLISHSSSELDLIQLSKSYSDSSHPNLLIASIIILFIILILLCYAGLPFVPGIFFVRCTVVGLSVIMTLLWGLGSMLQMTAVTSVKNVVGPASLYLVKVNRGVRAEAITWTAFSMILLVTIGSSAVLVQEVLRIKNKVVIPPKV